MKKILFVIDSLNCGGAEKSLVSLLPLLDAAKYEIHLWILSRGGVFEALLPNHIIVVESPKYNWFETMRYHICHLYFSIYYRCQKKYGKNAYPSEVLWRCCGGGFKGIKGSFDVAIAYGQGLSTYMTVSKVKAQKYIGWVNSDIFATGYDIPFNMNFYDRMSYIVSVSEKLKHIMQIHLPQYNHKYRCIYDILNPALIREMADESVDDLPNDNRLKLLTVARFVPPKGHDLLVQAAQELKKHGVPFVWQLIGIGILYDKVKEMVKNTDLEDSVIFLGLKTNPYPYMKKCDIYVQTSHHEGFGITISEAKILKKHIVSTDFDTVYDQISNEKNGLIVKKSGKEIADGIMRMMSDEKLRQNISINLDAEDNTKFVTEVKKVEKLIDE